MYVYNKVDRWMSNEIIRTGKYEPRHISNFLDILIYYGKKIILKKKKIFLCLI